MNDRPTYDIFISYRRATSQNLALIIFQGLKNRGFKVFLDHDGLDGQKTFDVQIKEKIAAAPVFVPILSRGCLDRCLIADDYVRMEIDHAVRMNRTIVAVVDKDFDFGDIPPSLPDSITRALKHTGVNFHADLVDGVLDAVIKKAKLEPPPSRNPEDLLDQDESRPGPELDRRLAWLLPLVAVVVAIALVAALAVWKYFPVRSRAGAESTELARPAAENHGLQTVISAEKRLALAALGLPDYDPAGNHALLIGIGDYVNWPDLQAPAADVAALSNVLVGMYGFSHDKVRTLTDAEATADGILAALENASTSCSAGDALLVYFAGHAWVDPSSGLAYWVPSEADQGDVSDYLPIDAIARRLDQSGARSVLLVVDSCFAGRGESPEKADVPGSAPARWLLASGGDEPVADSGFFGHSVFNYSLVAFLRGETEPGLSVFTEVDLIRNLVPKVRQLTAGVQVPSLAPMPGAGASGGHYVFCRLSEPRTVSHGTENMLAEISQVMRGGAGVGNPVEDNWTSAPLMFTFQVESATGNGGEDLAHTLENAGQALRKVFATRRLVALERGSDFGKVVEEIELSRKGLLDERVKTRMGRLFSVHHFLKFAVDVSAGDPGPGGAVTLSVAVGETSQAFAFREPYAGPGDIGRAMEALLDQYLAAYREDYPLQGRVLGIEDGAFIRVNLGRYHGLKAGTVLDVRELKVRTVGGQEWPEAGLKRLAAARVQTCKNATSILEIIDGDLKRQAANKLLVLASGSEGE